MRLFRWFFELSKLNWIAENYNSSFPHILTASTNNEAFQQTPVFMAGFFLPAG